MALGADDDVVVQHDAEALARLGDVAGDVDVGAAGRGIARGMVVDLSALSTKCILIRCLRRDAMGVEPLIGACNSCRLREIPVRPAQSRERPDLHADASLLGSVAIVRKRLTSDEPVNRGRQASKASPSLSRLQPQNDPWRKA